MSELITVVVCVKNGASFLAQALASLEAQTHRPLEVLVVDGGSTDGSRAIAEGCSLCRWLPQQGETLPDAYNTGIRQARGEWIAFLSHDDLYRPDKLTHQLAALRARPDCLFATGQVRFFLEGSQIPPGFRPELLVGEHPGKIMETLLAHRSAFERVGLLDPAYPNAHDVDWFARAGDLGVEGVMLDAVVVDKRVHSDNTSMVEHNRLLATVLKRSLDRKRQKGQPASGGPD